MSAPAGADAWRPGATPTTQPFWDAVAKQQLCIQRCTDCAAHVFYPRERCPHCGSSSLQWVPASGRARLETFAISFRPARGFEDECPYVIAVVELDEGVRMMTNLVDIDPSPHNIHLDMTLEVTFRERAGVLLPFFRPTTQEDS